MRSLDHTRREKSTKMITRKNIGNVASNITKPTTARLLSNRGSSSEVVYDLCAVLVKQNLKEIIKMVIFNNN